MPVFTVHEPPLRAAEAQPDAERFVFVRDGFSWCAFLFAPLWMLWHRMWLVLLGYVVISAALDAALVLMGASRAAVAVVGFLISLLIGLEASTLHRFTLTRRGWKNVGVVSGEDIEDVERRFFESWLHDMPAAQSFPAGPMPTASAASVPRAPRQPDVIGLFPEPGARR